MEPIGRPAAKTQPAEPARRAVAEAIRALAAEGVTDLVAVPSMFTPGGVHAEIEIPETIDELRAELPHVRLQHAWPFAGEHVAASVLEHLRQFSGR